MVEMPLLLKVLGSSAIVAIFVAWSAGTLWRVQYDSHRAASGVEPLVVAAHVTPCGMLDARMSHELN